MHPYKPRTLKPFFIVLMALFCFYSLKGQTNLMNTNTTIQFSDKELSLKECLEELNAISDINIVYSGTREFRRFKVQFPRNNMTVKDAFNTIQAQNPVEIIENNDYIIVKIKDLKNAYNYTGQVIDKETGETLVGVNIYSKDYTYGTVTDATGNFSFYLPPNQYEMIFSYMGYTQKSLDVKLFNDIHQNIELAPSELEIEEVNIIANIDEYDRMKIGRTITKIEAKTINNLNTNDINDALQGRVNGVWVTKVSGAPGDHNKIRVRGISSIFGSTDPLYVVDGMIVPIINLKSLGISDLNTHDISQVTVLKDASSTSLYGYLGGNGVVDIKTKTGGGKEEVEFSVKTGRQFLNKRYDFLETKDFLANFRYADTLFGTDYFRITPLDSITKYPFYYDTLANNDFQDLLFQRGVISEYQLSIKGQANDIAYYISGNVYNHQGIIPYTQYNKRSLTCNFSKLLFKGAVVRLLYKGSHQKNINNLDNYLGNKSILRGINYEPAYNGKSYHIQTPERLFLNNTEYASIKTLSDFKYSQNQLLENELRQKNQTSNSLTVNTTFPVTKSLNFKSSHSVAIKAFEFNSNDPHQLKRISSNENYIIYSQQLDLVFEKGNGIHNLSAFLRYRNYRDMVYWEVTSTNMNLENYTLENDLYLRGSQSIFGEKGSVKRKVNSAIASCASYNYKEKYFLSFLLNYDHITEGYYLDNYGLLPSVSFNYDLSKERILHLPLWINAFNLYVNWGKSGNYPLNSLSNELFVESTYYANREVAKAVRISNLANHDLKHEEVEETNYGANISLFKHKLTFTFDYFTKHNTNLLIYRQIPYYYGGGDMLQNIGKMENEGIELSLELVPVNRPDFYLSTKIGYSKNHQIITDLYNHEHISFNNTDLLYPDFYARENETLGSITGYKTYGLWNDSIHGATTDQEHPQYINVNGLAYHKADTLSPDELVDEDKVVIGNSIPDFTLNWLTTLEYKNFSCEMLWYGVLGVDKYNATKASTYITGLNADVQNILTDSLNYMMSEPFYESSFFIEDASFIRLKTLSFTYRQPKKIKSEISVTYTLSFENLFTLTKYSGYDPEASVYTSNNFSDNAIDRGAYPSPKGIFATVHFKF